MSEVIIKVRDHGPLLVEGPVKVIDVDGNAYSLPAGKTNYVLCRCGHSKNKPFCDGAHKAAGFVSCERVTPPTT
jgi:CDGSH iron-sulfur domain-containing protein 3